MPKTRKKVIKTVYKDDNDSEAENSDRDFSDSGSEAEIPEQPSSESDVADDSAEEFERDSKPRNPRKKLAKAKPVRKVKFAKDLLSKINRQSSAGDEDADIPHTPVLFSVKDLTEEDKLLPSVLNLSESDSSDDESPPVTAKKPSAIPVAVYNRDEDSETETHTEYKDVWSLNKQDDSEEIAKKTFMELEKHKTQIEETKASILNYTASQTKQEAESDVKNLLAMGEETAPEHKISPVKKGRKKKKDDSDSEMEDWEEVKEAKGIPQQGLQLIVDFPDAQCRKSKKMDIEMMMKRKMNRVKKEYQVYMHKVHVLCWLGHGNYVSRVLNDQEVLSSALSLVPSKDCYPGERVDMKYLEQITTWFKDKLSLKQDKNEGKFKPKAPPLKETLIGQTKAKVVTTKKYLVFIFISMLRALGLQCRVMFNFTTLPIKPPSSELCSLSTKPKDEKKDSTEKETKSKTNKKSTSCKNKSKGKLSQIDGNDDSCFSSDSDLDDIMQLDGNDDDVKPVKTLRPRANRKINNSVNVEEDVSPPKKARKSPSPSPSKITKKQANTENEKSAPEKRKRSTRSNPNEEVNSNPIDKKVSKLKALPKTSLSRRQTEKVDISNNMIVDVPETEIKILDTQNAKTVNKIASTATTKRSTKSAKKDQLEDNKLNLPGIIVTDENNTIVSSLFLESGKQITPKRLSLARNQSKSPHPSTSQKSPNIESNIKIRSGTRSTPSHSVERMETSKYFNDVQEKPSAIKRTRNTRKKETNEDQQRVSHRDLLAKNKAEQKNDVTGDLVKIIKKRVKEAKDDSKKRIIKGKVKDSDEDSDHLPEEELKRRKSESDEDFKPKKISPKPSGSKKIDRRVLSSDTEELPKNKCDVWCEVFVEELEQWIAVDVIKAKVHCTNEIYTRATHPVCYVVGWDNNNYLKDLTRRYVPHWNTVTRKQRVEPAWWETATKPWLGPKTAKDREEDDQLDRMQLDAPLPKSIAEYKNHPLYALKRHLLKFEAIYPPDAATLGFVRSEAVFARECVYVCRSRDTWLKEAKVVRLGEQPYKVVKARPKWDKLSNKMITDKPLEVFGSWQVDDYEPPTAENGVVPRNAYGNVELFKECMLPKGTVHIKLPALNRVAKKLNIDCAPAMTGFDFNGGWSHPVYDGFVVCKEFEEIITEAWIKDQEDLERREREKIELRVYGNWKRLIKGLFIRERLKIKYGFEEPAQQETKKKHPKLVVKKRT